MNYTLQKKFWSIIRKRKIEMEMNAQINTSDKARMSDTCDYKYILEENEALKKELAELKEKMKFLDLNGKPCERCNEPVLYEGNEGKIDSYGDVVCGECFAGEQYEKRCFPDSDEEADWECEYCEKDGFYNQEGMVEESIYPNGDWSETYCWCNERCHQKWLKRQQKKQDNILFASFHFANDEVNSANDELNSAIDASGNALY